MIFDHVCSGLGYVTANGLHMAALRVLRLKSILENNQTSSKSLTREQAAFLAALLPNPKYYQDNRNDRKLQYRKRVILKYMNGIQLPQ